MHIRHFHQCLPVVGGGSCCDVAVGGEQEGQLSDNEEGIEEAQVPGSNAVEQPRTMVVELVHTAVTALAVSGAVRAEELAVRTHST